MSSRPLPWTLLILLAGVVWGGDALPGEPATVGLGGFDKQLDNWSFTGGAEYPGATGTLTWQGTVGHAAPGAASLGGDFSAGGRYVGMRLRKVNRLATEFAFWVKPDGLAKSIMVRLTDAGDQTFHYQLPLANGTDWQRIAVAPGITIPQSTFSGSKDGKWQGHIAAIVIGLTKESITQGGVVACLIDDVVITIPAP